MATKKQAAEDTTPETVEAFVLVDCSFGKCRDVVVLSAAEAQCGAEAGELDLNPAAIAAAKE